MIREKKGAARVEDQVRIGIIGDFDPKKISHRATHEALLHSADYLGINLDIDWLPTKPLESAADEALKGYDGLWCAPGSPYISYHGALRAICFAREHDVPFIGTCGGFQHAVMEYAQNVLNMGELHHEEWEAGAGAYFISALSCSLVGETRKIYLKHDSQTQHIYGAAEIEERYNCSFGLNPTFQEILDKGGFHIAGTDAAGEARIFELTKHRFYVATLFQPQLSSTGENPHKLIVAYLLAARNFHGERWGNRP
jgi:CTP synthase (UTP-ammonia lyase)